MNFIYLFKNFLKCIDIFGKKTDFRINNRNKFTTTIGGCFTLIFIVVVLFLFFSLGNDMIERKNPASLFSQEFDTYPKATLIGKNDYFFTFGLQDYKAIHFYDESIYTVEFIYSLYNKTIPYVPTKINIPFERCTLDHLPENQDLKSYFNSSASNLNDLLCIKKEFDDKFDLMGTWDSEHFHQITIKINKCVNSTFNKNCKTNEEIEKRIGTSYFAFYSTDYLIDVRNFSNPATRIGRNYYIDTSLKVQKSILRTISDTHITTDEGWIVNDIKEIVYPTYFSDRESFTLGDFNNIATMLLRKSNYVNIHTRRYKKIQNVMADMGGFIQLIIIILFSLSYFCIRRDYYETIVNQVYDFENEKLNTINNNEIKLSEFLSSSENIKINFQNITQRERENENNTNRSVETRASVIKKKKEEKILSEIFKQKQIPLHISYYERIKSFFSSNNLIKIKKNQEKKGIKSIFGQLDITYVLRKFQEIEKLKLLLLDENQFHLFEFLPKPVILKNSKINLNYGFKKNLINSNNKKPSVCAEMISYDDDLIMKSKIVSKAYNSIIEKENLSEIDRKLIDFLDDEIKNLLKNNSLPPNTNRAPRFNTSPHLKTSPKLLIDFDSSKISDKVQDIIISEKSIMREKEEVKN